MRPRFTRQFTALNEHIDELGHVNNTVWLQWVQDIATEHWAAAALSDHQQQYFWVVIRHEIDYRGNIAVGESVTGETWIDGEPRGARSVRRVDFLNADGKVIVSAATTWALIDRENGRLTRIRPDMLAPFCG